MLYPVLDSARVDERRAALGLMPLGHYLRLLESLYTGQPSRRPLANLQAPNGRRCSPRDQSERLGLPGSWLWEILQENDDPDPTAPV